MINEGPGEDDEELLSEVAPNTRIRALLVTHPKSSVAVLLNFERKAIRVQD